MEFDWNLGELAEGLRCYRRGEFFAAHECWEILWRKCQGEERAFLQALIQMAGAFHHWERGNRRGALGLLRGSLRRLEAVGPRYGGVDVARLHAELLRWREGLESGEAELTLAYPKLFDGEASARRSSRV
jgi:predicted metal-dependent hydrolase